MVQPKSSTLRGQKYDGASNVMGKKSGVATILLVEQPKALVTHCQGHSLSLAVNVLTACCKISCDTMREISTKHSQSGKVFNKAGKHFRKYVRKVLRKL